MHNLGRTLMTLRCRDCESIVKIANAGRIVKERGRLIQLMHNGIRVVAGGYHGDWMAHIIRGLNGHHEPQEELVFHSLLKFVRHNSLIVELGSFWAYYTLWYLNEIPGSRAICIEPDPTHMAIGQRNARLNSLQSRIRFVDGWVDGSGVSTQARSCESTGEIRSLPSFNMSRVAALAAEDVVEMVHIDAQGVELEFIRSMAEPVKHGRVRFLVVSTHHSSISGSSTTHADCLNAINEMGGAILAEHSVQESFSGDGLIAASFRPGDQAIELPPLSRNQPENSLFPTL
jgi:FkbM family methyltransferase